MTVLSSLPPGIRSYLDEFIVRSRRLTLVRAMGKALALFSGWMLLCCAADRFLHLPAAVRFVTLLGGAVIFTAALLPALLALRHRPDWVWAAGAVERQNPRFAQRLLTVTSRLLGAADYRGSDEILLRLVHEVDEQLAAERAARLLPLRHSLAPWGFCSFLFLLMAGLFSTPDLRFRDLSIRFLNPLSNVPPVTTTQLSVSPGNRDVVQAQSLTIQVKATRLGDAPLTLHLSDDGRDWSRVTLTPALGGNFSFALASVDRDVRYYLSGGDARSPEYLIRVLRRPAVAQFRIRYEYPSYTRLPVAVVTNSDGKIEAPAGTKVLLTITSTEPLQDALLTIGGDKVLMERTSDPHSRQASLVVRTSTSYWLDLISARDVPGSGPAGTAIHAIPDSPPQVRLADDRSLRLTPREILPVSYDALDDYGMQSLTLCAQVNDRPPVEMPMQIWADPRRQQDVFNLDLATLPLSVGDVLAITVLATDTAGQQSRSPPLYVLVSPRSVDMDTYQRLAELQSAVQLAQGLASELEEAAKAEDQAAGRKDHQSPAYLSVASRGDRSMSTASQTAVLLRQALLRTITHSHSPQLSVLLAEWVDAAELESAAAQDAFRQSGAPGGMPAPARRKLQDAAERARQLVLLMGAVEQGEQAAALLADHDDLRQAQMRPLPADRMSKQRLAQTFERMRQEITSQASQIGIDAQSAEFEKKLAAKISAEEALVNAARPVDFGQAGVEWVVQLQHDPQQRTGLESRLSAAAQAEAIRRDADLLRARDLELASRAAACIAASVRGGGQLADARTLGAFSADLRILLSGAAPPATQPAANPGTAGNARLELMRMAGMIEPQPSTSRSGALAATGDRQKEAEDLAMQASAAAAEHQYQQATALDRALLRRLQSRSRRESARGPATVPATSEAEPLASGERVEHHRQAVQTEMDAAQRLDDLNRQQQQVAGQIGAGPNPDLANRQQRVAEQIAGVQRQRTDRSWSDPETVNAREKATAAVLAAQEQLAGMPQALAGALSAAAARRDAVNQVAIAEAQARMARPEQRSAAVRTAEQAQRNARDAADGLARAIRPVAPGVAEDLARQLEPFVPETEAARDALFDELLPALGSLQETLNGYDAEAVDFAAADVRQAIEDTQRELSLAQDQLLKRDPLMAAKWFARAAAQSLALRPPDVGSARRHQADVSAALARAWDQSIHRAAAQRLAVLPSLAAVLGPPAPSSGATTQSARQSARFPAAREWGRLRAQEGPDTDSTLRESDPPEYEQALKLYFEALGKAQEAKGG